MGTMFQAGSLAKQDRSLAFVFRWITGWICIVYRAFEKICFCNSLHCSNFWGWMNETIFFYKVWGL